MSPGSLYQFFPNTSRYGLVLRVSRLHPKVVIEPPVDGDRLQPDDDERRDDAVRRRRRHRGAGGRTPRSSYDPLQRLDKKELVQRIRSVEAELDVERESRSALAYDQQALLAKMIRLETEIILLQSEKSHSD